MNRRAMLFALWALQGLIACGWLAALPGDTGRGLLLGLSASRLAVIATLLGLAGGSGILAWRLRGGVPDLSPTTRDRILLAALAVVLLAPITILVLRALGQSSGGVYLAYAARLAPLAFWFGLAAFETIAWQAWDERAAIQTGLKSVEGLLRGIVYALAGLAVVVLFVLVTRLGLSPTQDGSWGSPATPFLEWQIALALASGIIVLVSAGHWKWLERDRWVGLLVYLYTCVIWLSQPLRPGFFATPARPPNFEVYPFSDALIYAQYAQSALAGYGFQWPDVPTRPLYIAMLTWLHAIGGQDYGRVIVLQTLILAAFPAVLYLIGKELGGRPLGIGLSLLAVLRDLTANVAAPFALNYTYSKLFFSEMPAALLISLFTLMTLRWMRAAPGERSAAHWYALLAGGVLGLASLIRLQSAGVLFAVLPIGFFVMKDRRRWAVGAVLMIVGIGLALSPWLLRNYRATGGLVLDNPTSQSMVLARRWSGDNGNDLIPYLPGEGAAQYSSRMNQMALASLRQDPGRILGTAANHFFNNEIDNLLVFPLRDQLNSPSELLWPEHAFWQARTDHPTGGGQIALIALYLILFGTGLGAAWHRNGPIGLLPLGLSAVYNAWTALFLSSGDRFLVPVDWGVYLYHFLGLLTLAALLLSGLKSARANIAAWLAVSHTPGAMQPAAKTPFGWRGVAISAVLVLAAGASIPLTETLFPKSAPIQATLNPTAPGEVVLYGRAIYPRYYAAGEGEPGSGKLGYGKSNEARLVFFLIGETDTLVVFPTQPSPAFFPNASDVAVVGTQVNGVLRAREIILKKDGKTLDYVP